MKLGAKPFQNMMQRSPFTSGMCGMWLCLEPSFLLSCLSTDETGLEEIYEQVGTFNQAAVKSYIMPVKMLL